MLYLITALGTAAAAAAVYFVWELRRLARALRPQVKQFAEAKSAYDAAVAEMRRRILTDDNPQVVRYAPPAALNWADDGGAFTKLTYGSTGARFAQRLFEAFFGDPDIPLTYDEMKGERDRAAKALLDAGKATRAEIEKTLVPRLADLIENTLVNPSHPASELLGPGYRACMKNAADTIRGGLFFQYGLRLPEAAETRAS